MRRGPTDAGGCGCPTAATVLGLLVVAVGCDTGPADRGTSVRDSAGVRIVENSTTAVETWTVADTSAVEIGRATGPPARQFDRIRAARILSDGGVAVADGGTRQVRVFGPDGEHRFTVGGEGPGPGEFRSLDGLEALDGDTLVVWDRRSARLSLFGPGGELVRTLTADGLRGETVDPRGLVGVLPDGAFVVHRGFAPEEVLSASGVAQLAAPVVRVGPEGTELDTLARPPGPAQYVTTTSGGEGVIRTDLLLAAAPHVEAGAGRIFAADGGRWEVRVLRPDGTLEALIRRRQTLRPARERDVEAAIERRVGQAPARVREPLRRRLEETPARDTLPAISDLLVDATGDLWAREFTPDPDDTGLWWVFDGRGRLRAAVRTPPGLRVEAVGRDRVIGVHEGGLGVERIRVHRLERG